MSTTAAEASEIAQWMLAEYLKTQRLRQSIAARAILEKYGERHLYRNANGNWAINKPILEEFKRIRPVDVEWIRDDQLWRKRRDNGNGAGIRVS